jgi:hypothetical protein
LGDRKKAQSFVRKLRLLHFLPVRVLPTLVTKFIGAATTVFTVETDALATVFVVFVTVWVTELIGLKSDAAAGRTSARNINIIKTAAKTRPILKIMIIILY